MTFRFPSSRFTLSCAALAASLAAVTLHPALAQSSKQTPIQESPYQGTVVEEIIAHVNDQAISRSDFARAQQDLENQGRQQQWTQQQLFEQKRDLLRDLIDRQLLLSRGKDLDINGETELVKRLDDMRKQNHLDSMEALQKAAEDQGVSWEDFKANMRNQIVTQQVIRDEVGRRVNVTPSELQTYYNQHQQDFEKPEQERLSEIMVPTANPDDASQVDAAKKKADDLYAKLKAGSDFAELAKSSSGGSTAAEGGDLGSYERGSGKLAKVFEDQTLTLQPGQFTEPIRTKQGFVILKVTEHNKGGLQPYKDVEAQVEDAVGMAKMGPALRDYLTKLREDAYINISNGYEDSGATANQMKLEYTAYTPPSPKKKKKVARTRYYQKRGRAAKQETAAAAPAPTAPPAGVPSLADAPQGNASAPAAEPGAAQETATAPGAETAAAPASAANAPAAVTPAPAPKQQVATTAKAQKPGKKEKIRFGQAPRETLPSADTKTEDAGATSDSATNPTGNGSQVAANATPANPGASNIHTLNADGTMSAGPDAPVEAKKKTRYSYRAKEPKAKKDNNDPFAPPPATKDEVATRKEQQKALGLNGDTSKVKKPNPAKTGPKRRMSDEKKDETQPQNGQPTAPSSPSAPANAPAPANTPPSAPAPAGDAPAAPAPASPTQHP
jgi:peptidyl-prolyl cis-trans isomerase SurA